MTIAPILLSNILPLLVSGPPQSAPRPDSSASTALVAPKSDTGVRPAALVIDTSAHPIPKDSTWNTEISLTGGFASVDFPQRSRFVDDLGGQATLKGWIVDQPFGGSDIGPRVGFEAALRRRGSFRLAIGGWYQGWSAQAIARDSAGNLNYRTYGSDLLIASMGGDLLISKSIMRLDGGRDAYLGGRFLVGAGRLDGRTSVWGTALGASMAAGAEFLDWKKLAVAAQLGLDWLTVQSPSPWSDVLWNNTSSDKVNWSGGGLSLVVALRWGSPHDSIPGQKTTNPTLATKPKPQVSDSTKSPGSKIDSLKTDSAAKPVTAPANPSSSTENGTNPAPAKSTVQATSEEVADPLKRR